MIRRLIAIASAALLLISLATALAWASSYSTANYIRIGYWHRRPHPAYGRLGYGTATDLRILHAAGRLDIGMFMSGCVDGPGGFRRTGPGEHGEAVVWAHPAGTDIDSMRLNWFRSTHRFLGVHLGLSSERWQISFPDGFIVFLLVASAASPWLLRLRPRKQGLCHKCGYDLTGNTSGICPECGKPVTVKTGAST